MRTILISLISFLFLLSSSVFTLYAQTDSEDEEWYWFDRDSVRHTPADLGLVLSRHNEWLKEVEQLPEKIKEDNETLEKAKRRVLQFIHTPHKMTSEDTLLNIFRELSDDPRCLSLRWANLTNAKLLWQNLSAADLLGTNLSGADLSGAQMIGTYLGSAKLVDADMLTTDLYGADLNWADLSNASLYNANLEGTNLKYANLSGAFLLKADMKGAIFEPRSLPSPQNIALTKNLSRLTYEENPAPLIELRNRLKEAGYRKQAKEVNAAYRRTGATWLETFLYDWTCEYGIAYNRPFIILGVGIFIFGALYLSFARVFRSGRYNYLVATKRGRKKERDEGEELWLEDRFILKKLGIAMLFSLQRALRIGYRQFSPDNWIKMALHPKFEITSRGWPRFVSALQSIIGIGLVILALLSYFGSPFEY